MAMNRLSEQLASTKTILERAAAHDLRKGYFYTLMSLAAATWLIAILALIYSRIGSAGPSRSSPRAS